MCHKTRKTPFLQCLAVDSFNNNKKIFIDSAVMYKSMDQTGISLLIDPNENVTKIKLVPTKCQRCTRGLFSALVRTSNLKMSYKSTETDGTTALLA